MNSLEAIYNVLWFVSIQLYTFEGGVRTLCILSAECIDQGGRLGVERKKILADQGSADIGACHQRQQCITVNAHIYDGRIIAGFLPGRKRGQKEVFVQLNLGCCMRKEGSG